MADVLQIENVALDGFDSTLAESISPYAIDQGTINLSPSPRKYEWTESGYSSGSAMVGSALMGNVERSWPVQVRARFTTAHTNLVTNPRPYSVVTGWQAEGSGSTVTYNTVATENVIQAVTTGSANSGMETSFTGTAASYSAGVWVKISTGTAACVVKFDGETGTAFTATTSWQFVKTEGVTLTATTRYLQILQTDTGSRTIYVKLAGVVLNSTYPGYIDGACGDARWNSTAHASTSTALTGQDAINLAYDTLAELGERAIYNTDVESSDTGGTGLVAYWTPNGASKGRTILTVKAIDVDGLAYGYDHHRKNIARSEVRLVCHPYALGPEYTLGTGSKPAGTPAMSLTLTGAKGAIKGPARLTFTAGSSQDQRFAMFGIQGRDYVSGASLIIRGPDLGTSGYSGSSTAHTNEVQVLTPTGTISGGTYTLALDGKTTSSIAYNANAATIQAALEALANVDTSDIVVTGGPLSSGAITFTFSGSNVKGCNVSQIVYTGSVTGGGSASMATTTAGVPGYISSALYDEWTTICDTGNLTHVGSYQVWARVYDNAATTDLYDARVRLTWGVGDLSSTTTNDSVVPQAVGDYSLVDLGQIHIPTVATGTQRWKGRIEGKTSGTAGNTLRVVDVMFVPVETGFGLVKMIPPTSSSVSLFENFGATSGALTGDTATSGQTWASIGGVTDATDFTETAAPDNSVIRTEVNDTSTNIRYGRGVLLGVGTFTDVIASVTVKITAPASGGHEPMGGVIVRATDNSNFVAATLGSVGDGSGGMDSLKYVHVYKVLATTATQLLSVEIGGGYGTSFTSELKFRVSANGAYYVYVDGTLVGSGTDANFASGTLASGMAGLIDWNQNGSASTRTYSNFRVLTPAAETPAAYASQDLQFRPTGDALREDSTGAGIYTPLGNATVSHLPELTPSGPYGLSNRLLCVTSRNNPDLGPDPLPDAFDLAVLGRPVFALARSST